jgi:maleylpyruvate isomerase
MTTERDLATELLDAADRRLVRTVDGFHGDDWTTPSLLPGWSRAHVVAHLALNAEALGRVLRAIVADDARGADGALPTMYDSSEQRDSDITELAVTEPGEIRDRLLAGVTNFKDAVAAVPDDAWSGFAERTPGQRRMPTSAVPGMRVREVEIHHADLGAGYSPTDWSTTFAILLLNAMSKRAEPAAPFEVRPLDLDDRSWSFGVPSDADAPVAVVTGPAADLGWWLTGRPPTEAISASRGDLPTIGKW